MTPLLRVTAAFLAGLLAGLLAAFDPDAAADGVAAGPWRWGVLPLVAAALLLAGPRWRGRIALLLFALLGAVAGLDAAREAAGSCAARFTHGQRVVLTGYLAAEPVAGRAVAFQATSPCREELRVSLPPGAAGFANGSSGEALATAAAAPTGPGGAGGAGGAASPAGRRAGEPLVVSGRWMAFEATTRWPVAPAYRGLLRVREVRAAPAGERAGPLPRWRLAAQRAYREALPHQHGVAEALVLAQRDALDPAVRDAFVASGMAHLLSISGSHVLVFAGVVLLLLRLLRMPLRGARIAAVVVICVYVLALGAPGPAARAALQFALLSAAVLLQRPTHAWSVMAGAALVLLVSHPLNALDAGFQLSFAGVCGLLALRRRLIEAAPRRVPRFLRDELGTGIAATVTTAPIAALHFGQFAPIGLLASVLAGPLLTLALPALALLLVLHALSPPLAAWFGPGIEMLLAALLAVAKGAAAVSGGHLAVDAGTVMIGLVTTGVLLLFVARQRERQSGATTPAASPVEAARRRRLQVLRALQAVALVALVLAWAPGLAPGSGRIELHAIDVGQGDAIAIRTPRNRWILVDAGMRTERSDMGQRRVVPYLLSLGVRRIDLLVLTHPHADHIGGALAVLAALDVGTIVDPGVAAPSRQLIETLHAARAEPARWITPRAGSELQLDGVRLRFLYPQAPLLDAPDDPNDLSVVFRLAYGRFTALFTGDATRSVEALLLATRPQDLRATLLKVGHHGSRTSSGEDFLEQVDPRIALISAGRDNRYGHPAPEIVARLLRQGIEVVRTDVRGSIRIRARRSGEVQLTTQR